MPVSPLDHRASSCASTVPTEDVVPDPAFVASSVFAEELARDRIFCPTLASNTLVGMDAELKEHVDVLEGLRCNPRERAAFARWHVDPVRLPQAQSELRTQPEGVLWIRNCC